MAFSIPLESPLITLQRVTSDAANLHVLAPRQPTIKKRRSGGKSLAIVSDLTGPGIELYTSRADSEC